MIAAYLLALRLGRWGVAGFGAIAFLVSLLQAAAFYQVAGHTPAERQVFGRSMTVLATQFTVIIAPPMRPDTVGGYVQWRAFGFFAILFAIWALASASAAARGDEERGIVPAVLAAGMSRLAVTASRIGAFATAALIAALAGSAGLLVGVASGRESFSLGAALAAAVILVALAVCCYALTLLVAQLTSARGATPVAGVILLGLFLLNSLSRSFDGLVRWRWLSPFHYYEQSSPLVPGGGVDFRATLTLFVLAAVAAGVAGTAFRFRDIGSPLFSLPVPNRPAGYDASKAPVWRVPILRDLYDRRVGLLAWTVGVAALGVIFVALTKNIVQPLLAIPGLARYFGTFITGDVFSSFFSYIWFGFAQLLMAGFAITQVARWSAEDSDGRLELILSNPVSRLRVLVERMVVLAIGALIIAAVSGIAIGIAAQDQSISLDRGRLAVASLLLVPFTLIFGTVGALLASRFPRATVGVLGAFAFASYVLVQLGPIFKLPTWVEDISPFQLYGQPLTAGVDQTGLVIMLAIVVAGLAGSSVVMERRDVGA